MPQGAVIKLTQCYLFWLATTIQDLLSHYLLSNLLSWRYWGLDLVHVHCSPSPAECFFYIHIFLVFFINIKLNKQKTQSKFFFKRVRTSLDQKWKILKVLIVVEEYMDSWLLQNFTLPHFQHFLFSQPAKSPYFSQSSPCFLNIPQCSIHSSPFKV